MTLKGLIKYVKIMDSRMTFVNYVSLPRLPYGNSRQVFTISGSFDMGGGSGS